MSIKPASSADDFSKIFGPKMGQNMTRAGNMVLKWAGKKIANNAINRQMLSGGVPLVYHPTSLTHRSGDLRRSIYTEMDQRGHNHALWVGAGRSGPAASYAHVHEQQGKLGTTVTIRPIRKQWLKIPAHPSAVTKAGRLSAAGNNQDLTWIQSSPNLAFLVNTRVRKDVTQMTGKIRGRIMFVMAKKVVIPSRPFLNPAINEVVPKMHEHLNMAMQQILAGKSLQRKV